MQKSMSLKYEPASELLHIYVQKLLGRAAGRDLFLPEVTLMRSTVGVIDPIAI